jgi:hypothetical protein
MACPTNPVYFTGRCTALLQRLQGAKTGATLGNLQPSGKAVEVVVKTELFYQFDIAV